jgi:hypothetical protein
MEWLAIWGVTQAVGFAFGSVLKALAGEALEGYVQNFFKETIAAGIDRLRSPSQAKALKTAMGQALTELLKLVQQELEDADYEPILIQQYEEPLQRFVQEPRIAAALGLAFEPGCKSVDTQLLSRAWSSLNFPVLPTEFDWEQVGKRYVKKVRAIVQTLPELEALFVAAEKAVAAKNLQAVAGLGPNFDLAKYAEGLRKTYGQVKLESLDSTGVYYDEMKLWQIFVPQTVRPCQEFNPKVYEIPKDEWLRLQARGDEEELAELVGEQYRVRSYADQTPRSVLEVVGGEPPKPVGQALAKVGAGGRSTPLAHYAVILGDPGSGKSTLLQYLALSWAEQPLRDLSQQPIPLMIELRTYGRDKQLGKCRDLLSFLHQGNVTCRLNQQDGSLGLRV